MSDRYAGMPPKMKRSVKTSIILPLPVLIATSLVVNYVEFWLLFLIVCTIAAAVFIPLGRAAAKEGRDIDERDSEL
ncbi:hypothetical protein M1D88_13140 [Arthrobacter sp. R1-13]